MKINILGTDYAIHTDIDDNDPLLAGKKEVYGITDVANKYICITAIAKQDNLDQVTLRHEIIHAFFYESGLYSSSLHLDEAWAMNEEMIDWLAIQAPKIFKVMQELKALT